MTDSKERMSSFDRDFSGDFGRVEETVVLKDSAFQFLEGTDPNDEAILQQFRLVVVSEDGKERAYPIHGEIFIGRSEDNHIVLDFDRSVSGRHVAVSTDGKLFWFSDLSSRHGTFVNGERVENGWLIGDEEIVVGNTRIFFRTPIVIVVPPPELEKIEKQFEEEEQKKKEAARKKEEKKNQPRKKAGVFKILFFLLLLGGSGWGVYWYLYDSDPKVTDPLEVKNKPLETALSFFEQGKSLLQEKKWVEADKAFRKAASEIPADNPMRKEVLQHASKAGKEVVAMNLFQQSKKLYLEGDKPQKALELLKEIKEGVHNYPEVKRFRARILEKELQPLLTQFQVLVEGKKCDKAEQLLPKMSLFAKEKQEEWNEKIKGCKDPKSTTSTTSTSKKKKGSKGRKNRVQRNNRSIPDNFQEGLSLYQQGAFTKAWIFFRRKGNSGNSSSRKQARFYASKVKEFEKNWEKAIRYERQKNVRLALGAFKNARSLDYSLGRKKSSEITKKLGKVYFLRGTEHLERKQYLAASSDFKKAIRSGYSQARNSLKQVEGKAKEWMTQAEALKGVADDEAKKLFRKVIQLLPSKHPLAVKAKQNL